MTTTFKTGFLSYFCYCSDSIGIHIHIGYYRHQTWEREIEKEKIIMQLETPS